MHIKINKNNILNVLQNAYKVTLHSGVHPILANVLLTAKDGKVEVFSANLTVYFKDVLCDAHIKTPGAVTVNAKKVFEIVKELPDGEITISLASGGSRLSIMSGDSEFNLNTLPPADYPSFPVYSGDRLSEVDPQALAGLFNKTVFAVSDDDARPNLNGVFLKYNNNDGVATIAATNGYGLAVSKKYLNPNGAISGFKDGVIIPSESFDDIKRILNSSKNSSPLHMSCENGFVFFKRGEALLAVRIIDGEFPSYEKVIPPPTENVLKVNKQYLVDALKRGMILSPPYIPCVKLTLSRVDDKVNMYFANPDIGDATERVTSNFSGAENAEIEVNAAFLIDALGVMESEDVVITLGGKVSPITLTGADDKDFIYVLMPVKS